jgi:peptide deformylase
MAILDILRYPDARLHKVARPVERVDDEVRALVRNMAETMYAAPGIGLAATQVDAHQRIIVIDTSDARDDLLVLINPEIIWASEAVQECEEGCLSVPGVYETVTRAEKVRVRALDANGMAFERDAEGMLAVCIQHEIDHLEGKVFVEYLSRLKQSRIRARMEKQFRQSA